LKVTPNELAQHGLAINQDGRRRSAFDLLPLPGIGWERLAAIWPAMNAIRPDVRAQIEIDAGYAGYLERQEADIVAFRREGALALPADLDYSAVGSLSNEVRQKLDKVRPATLGAAARIPGVTPAAMVALLRHVKRKAA